MNDDKLDKSEFQYVDIGRKFRLQENGPWLHSKWHRVKLESLPKYFRDHWGISNIFCTALRYAKPKHIDGEPEAAYGPLYFDFDADEEKGISLEDVFNSANILLEHFNNTFEPAKGAIRLWYSGGRSIHIEVNESILGVEPSERIHHVYGSIARTLKKNLELKSLDTSIYSCRRLWRYPSSKHHNGLFKVEIDQSELSSVETVLEKAKRPRHALYDPADLEFQTNENMASWINQFLAEVKRETYEPRDRTFSTSENQAGIDKVLKCDFIKFCEDNAAILPEPLWYAMISNLCRFTGGSDAIHELSKGYPEYSPKETDDKINHALKASGPVSCQKIREDGFECPRSCGVKSPAGLSFKRTNSDTDDTNEFPEFSNPLFRNYLELFEGKREMPREFNFFGLAAVCSMILGRRVFYSYARRLYPNMFILLVGKSGYSRKDTVISYSKDFLCETGEYNILSSLGSWEGLLAAMKKPEDLFDNIQYEFVFLTLSELDSLLRKAKNEAVSNLIPNLCTAYDCPNELRSVTKGNPIKIEKPFLSILAGIQPEILKKCFQSGDIHGGFSGRFCYITGAVKDIIPLPPPLDEVKNQNIIDTLKDIKDYYRPQKFAGDVKIKDYSIQKQSQVDSVEITLDVKAELIFKEFYNELKETQQKAGELLSTLYERIPDNVLKLAMIFAAVDKTDKISKEYMRDATNIGLWLRGNITELFHDFGKTLAQKAEEKILEILSRRNDAGWTRRKIQQYSHVDAERLAKTLHDMLDAGLIVEEKEGKRDVIKISEEC